ncbi:hypothetical protein MHYP_G00024340, partial [Metynnis hypsauchen]
SEKRAAGRREERVRARTHTRTHTHTFTHARAHTHTRSSVEKVEHAEGHGNCLLTPLHQNKIQHPQRGCHADFAVRRDGDDGRAVRGELPAGMRGRRRLQEGRARQAESAR